MNCVQNTRQRAHFVVDPAWHVTRVIPLQKSAIALNVLERSSFLKDSRVLM